MMETPPSLENCPPSPPLGDILAQGTSTNLEDARLAQLKIQDKDTMCVICWGSVLDEKKCFPENCLHIFCFDCLVKWSRQKNQCPLCKKVFDIIIYNVKSKTEYDKYQVIVAHREPSDSPINITDFLPIVPIEFPMMNAAGFNSVFRSVNFITNQSPRRRFTYRTRFEATSEQSERIQELFGGRSETENVSNYARLTPAEWRKYVYDRNLYAIPLPDAAGRHRESSAAFYRENPAQTHRLIPWLNRELVVLIPRNSDAIPQILEEMRELLCVHDIQSREMRDYFQSHLHNRTDHFIHEFHNFAISPYDIMGYDRVVDYQRRALNPISTYEISSNESSDGDLQVIDEIVSPPTATATTTTSSTSTTTVIASTADQQEPEHSTEIVVETSSAHEQNCTFNDMTPNHEIAENVPPASSEVVVESSDSECQFVLALKPPHLRTPEQVSLDSASDSDVIFVPNTSPKIKEISSDESDDNIPLSQTKKFLKQEVTEKQVISYNEPIPESFLSVVINPGPSTSSTTASNSTGILGLKKYYIPKRKHLSKRSIFSSSTSTSSSNSSSESSDEEWMSKKKSKSEHKKGKSQKKKRKKSTKKSKSSNNQLKPLSLLPSSEEARNDNDDDDDERIEENCPRIQSVIIRKNDINDQHYIEKPPSPSNSNQSSEEIST